MADNIFKIEVEPESAIKGLTNLMLAIKKGSLDGLDKVSDFVAERAILNAPIKTGALRKSIVGIEAEESTDMGEGYYEAGVIADTPYALRMHEAIYELGPISREQPGTPEGGVGNKYFTRVVENRTKDIVDEFTKTLNFYIQAIKPVSIAGMTSP